MKGYRCVLGLIIGVLVSGLQSGRAQDVLGHSGTPPRTSLPQSPTSITTDNPLRGADSVRGTITVIVSTRQGFVLAADSRATHSNGTHTDDAQKLFAIGNRAACVIAGLVQTGLGEQGFYVRDAMATNLNMLSENSNQTHTVNDAWSVTRYFLQTFSGMVGVLEHRPDGIIPAGNVGEVSAVSIDDSGKAQWITFYVPVDIVADRPNDYVVATSMPVVLYRPMDLGLRFDVGLRTTRNCLEDASCQHRGYRPILPNANHEEVLLHEEASAIGFVQPRSMRQIWQGFSCRLLKRKLRWKRESAGR